MLSSASLASKGHNQPMRVLFAIVLALSSPVTWEDQVASKAESFLKTLSSEQRKAASFPYDAQERSEWNYLPGRKPGVALRDLSEDQLRAAHTLLQSALSKAGVAKVQAIRALETVLFERENRNPLRDSEGYYISVFGDPSDKGVWAWRYEGHHTSLTFAFKNGKIVSSTPQFLGTNPEPTPLKKVRDLAYDLTRSLGAGQRKQAILSREVPGDILNGMGRTAEIKQREGIAFKDLDSGQKKLLEALIKEHASVQNEKEQERRWKMVQAENLDEVVFAWIGPIEQKARHYYRIQGRNMLIEFDSTQADGNHIHTVWRNLKEDFGADPLAEHYKHGHSH